MTLAADRMWAEEDYFRIEQYPPFGTDLSAEALEDGTVRIEINVDSPVGITLTRKQAEALATWIRCALVR